MAAPPLPNLTGGAAGPSSASSQSGFDNSGWVVNIGGGSAGAAMPPWVVIAAIVGGVVWLLRRR